MIVKMITQTTKTTAKTPIPIIYGVSMRSDIVGTGVRSV